MKPKFTATTTCTLDEFVNFNRFYIRQFARIPTLAFVAVVFFTTFMMSYSNTHIISLSCFVMPVILTLFAYVITSVFMFIAIGNTAKKAYTSNSTMQNVVYSYEFFEDCFTVESKLGYSKIQYSDLYCIYETEENLYPMATKSQGYIIAKADCSEELIRFVQEKK